MAPFERRERTTGDPLAQRLGCRLDDPCMRALGLRQALRDRLGLCVVDMAVAALEAVNERQQNAGAEAPREPDQNPRPQPGARRPIGRAEAGQPVAPELGMHLLDRREPAIDFFQLRVGLVLGHRAVKRGAVDLALEIVAIARNVALALGRIALRHSPPLHALLRLSEVVVVGYGTQRKEAVTGSVASISGEKIREVPSPNISQALQGRLAGIQISQTSTKPGATMQIRIRGTRSLTADNNPLIVLDGIPFPGSIGDLNPDDIKSIDVLKDASATAIYGSRGANGVILITTNKGQRGGKARITYNGYYGDQTLFARYPMMNGSEFAALRKAAGILSNGTDEADNVNTDWQDLFYRTGTLNSHDVTLSGGSETGSYNVGFGYYQNQSLIPTQQYTRYSFRTSVDQNVGKFFRFGFTTNNNYNISQGNQLGLFGTLAASPIANPYNPDGTLKRTINTGLGDNYVLTKSVIDSLNNKGLWLNENRGFATYNAVYGEVKIPWVDGLKYRVNLGLDFIQGNNGNYTAEGVNNVNPTTVSTAGISNSQTYHWTVENLLTYDHTFAQKHNVNTSRRRPASSRGRRA